MAALSLLIGDDLPVHIPRPAKPEHRRSWLAREQDAPLRVARTATRPKTLEYSRQAAVPRPYEAARHRADGRQFHAHAVRAAPRRCIICLAEARQIIFNCSGNTFNLFSK